MVYSACSQVACVDHRPHGKARLMVRTRCAAVVCTAEDRPTLKVVKWRAAFRGNHDNAAFPPYASSSGTTNKQTMQFNSIQLLFIIACRITQNVCFQVSIDQRLKASHESSLTAGDSMSWQQVSSSERHSGYRSDIQTDRQTDRDTVFLRVRQTETHSLQVRQTEKNRQKHCVFTGQTDREVDRQTDRQTDRDTVFTGQTDRLTER